MRQVNLPMNDGVCQKCDRAIDDHLFVLTGMPDCIEPGVIAKRPVGLFTKFSWPADWSVDPPVDIDSLDVGLFAIGGPDDGAPVEVRDE